MKEHSKTGIVCKVVAVVTLLAQEGIYLAAAFVTKWAEPLQTVLVMVAALFWPVLLWSFGTFLDRQKAQGQDLERILELLGGAEEPEEDLTQLEARLEAALEAGAEPEPEEE